VKKAILTLILAASMSAVLAQQPKTVNTQLHVEAAMQGLSSAIDHWRQSNQLLWVGYEVPALSGKQLSACSDWKGSSQTSSNCCTEYDLEEPNEHFSTTDRDSSSSSNVVVLLRIDHDAISSVRIAPTSCTLNASGLALEWLTGVSPDESVSFLSQLAKETAAKNADKHDKIVEGSLVALVQHATPKATDALITLASPPNDARLREKAAFWLGAARGHDGYVALAQLVAKEQDPKLREKLTFDLSVNNDPAATDELIRMAKADADTGVRGQALFWLAQKAGKKAVASLRDAAANDPNTEVKKKAVFALSQLPKDQSVPQLIQVAETNTNPEVRKQAIFWLGQTNDPRALNYLEEILKH
jgi:HEAT repeat protein